MTEWLNTISTVTNEKIREALYNIEQFRPDVVNLTSGSSSTNPNNNKGGNQANQSSSANPSTKGISSSTKTSGTTNMVSSSSGNSITGKNPFAILKASAIASTSTAKFPNNFQNLPKVTPPFLPALEGEEKNTKYTLVLDLDETLIHNVEVSNDDSCFILFLVWK